MNYEELRASYIKNFKIGLGGSVFAHLVIIMLVIILYSGKDEDKSKTKDLKFTYIDLTPGNLPHHSPSIIEEKSGGSGGGSSKVNGTPVPVKKVKEEIDFDPKAAPKGDSTKSGKGGIGTGTGTGSGTGSGSNPVNLFKKSDYLIAVEMQPEPIGGYSAIDKKVLYPEAARQNSIKGKVFIQAYINENGEVVFAEVLKGLGFGCDEAALRAVKLVRFKAGKQKGRYVKVQMSVPVNFIP